MYSLIHHILHQMAEDEFWSLDKKNQEDVHLIFMFSIKFTVLNLLSISIQMKLIIYPVKITFHMPS